MAQIMISKGEFLSYKIVSDISCLNCASIIYQKSNRSNPNFLFVFLIRLESAQLIMFTNKVIYV